MNEFSKPPTSLLAASFLLNDLCPASLFLRSSPNPNENRLGEGSRLCTFAEQLHQQNDWFSHAGDSREANKQSYLFSLNEHNSNSGLLLWDNRNWTLCQKKWRFEILHCLITRHSWRLWLKNILLQKVLKGTKMSHSQLKITPIHPIPWAVHFESSNQK